MSKKNDINIPISLTLKLVHEKVQQFPFLKEFLKKIIQTPLALISRPPFINNVLYRIDDAFLGFHDVSPWNFAGDKLAVHLSPDIKRGKISVNNKINIGIYSYASSSMEIIGSSQAFNWQQGSRLQWVGSENMISFNCIKNGRVVNALWDCNSKSMRYLPVPVYSWSQDGKYWVSVNFSAIEKNMPGYGYVGNYTEPISPGTFSIWSRSEDRMICNIDLRDYENDNFKLGNADFFISHFQFSSDGRTLAFFLRNKVRESWFITHLFLFDITMKKLAYVSCSELGTHFTWLNATEILIYMKSKSGSCFQILNTQTLKADEVPALSGMPDGHPYENNGKVIIDTYPDIFRNQKLYIYDPAKEIIQLINSVRSPLRYTQYSRIDMHPKMRLSESLVAFDTGAFNRQSVLVCKL